MAGNEVCRISLSKTMINESSTPSDLGRGISRLHLDEHNEQPQWQGLKYVPFFVVK